MERILHIKTDRGFMLKSFKYFLVGFCLAVAFSVRSFGAGPEELPAGPVEGPPRAVSIGPRPVEGAVKADTTWSGDILVAGDILVPAGVTLKVAPGTSVMFVSSESSKIEPAYLSMQTEIVVRGTLDVAGETANPVRFGPAPEDVNTKRPERGDWGGIIFDGPTASGSRIANARFVQADTAIAAYNSSPTITGCGFTDNRYGIVCMGKDAGPAIKGGSITAGEFGLLTAMGAKPRVEGCAITNNQHDILSR